mgnify:CR=1 FL=1
MAHFAKLGTDNIVEKVEVVSNNIATTEQDGINFLNNLYNTNDIWKQTSYNTYAGEHKLDGTPLRKNYAGIGYTYDEDRDAFIPPKPYSSWVLDEETCNWEAPVVYPDDGKFYNWNETNQTWELT